MQAAMEMCAGTQAEKAKRFLGQVQVLDRRVEAMLERAERSRARLKRLSGGGDGLRETAEKAALDERRLNEQIDRLVEMKRLAVEAISGLGDGEMQAILEMRYLNGMGWQAIALRMHMDRRTATRLHAKALERIGLPEWD